MSKPNPKILLAEDDLNLGRLLVDYLESEGFDLKLCKEILEQNPDIKFFIPVHLYGHALNLKLLKEIKEGYRFAWGTFFTF